MRRETQWIFRGVKLGPSGLSFDLPSNMGHYTDRFRSGYAFRVLDASGRTLAAEQSAMLEGVSPWQPASGETMPKFWFRKLDDTRKFHSRADARLLEKDVVGMSDSVTRLLTLVRLQGLNHRISLM